jgi:hypothetical protein
MNWIGYLENDMIKYMIKKVRYINGRRYKMNQDFNSIFWKILGVNNRVYELYDIFTVKVNKLDKKEIKKYKNLNRDKRADTESYDNFLKNDESLSNEKYMEYMSKETHILYIFLVGYLGDTEQVRFYINQLNNIVFNYKIFQRQKFDKENFINLFSFQIAYIIENMNYNSINTSNFDNSIIQNSIMPFFDKYREIRDCNNKIKKMSQKDLAYNLSMTNYQLKENIEKSNIYLEVVSDSKFIANLSNWKKNKELPSFIKLLTIINTIKEGNTEEKKGIFFQLLIIRALLHIQKEFNLEEAIRDSFLNKLSEFRKRIKVLLSLDNKNKVLELQNNFLIYYPNIFEDPERDLKSILEEIDSKQKEFFKHNDGDKKINIELQNREYIISTFNNCKTKEEYKKLLDEIVDVTQDKPHSDLINNSINFARLVISIKTEDKRLFNQRYKYVDRSFGTLLSHVGIEKNLSEYIEILKEKTDFIECINLTNEHFKKLSTIG